MPDGLEAIIFTADGDMRQALNNLQVLVGHITAVSTVHSGRYNSGRFNSPKRA